MSALALVPAFIGRPMLKVMKMLAWLVKHGQIFITIGKWILYYVILCFIFLALWYWFISTRGPNGGNDD